MAITHTFASRSYLPSFFFLARCSITMQKPACINLMIDYSPGNPFPPSLPPSLPPYLPSSVLPGLPAFPRKVDSKLSGITKQRMMDNGIGMDLLSLAQPPLHTVPLFICKDKLQLNSLG